MWLLLISTVLRCMLCTVLKQTDITVSVADRDWEYKKGFDKPTFKNKSTRYPACGSMYKAKHIVQNFEPNWYIWLYKLYVYLTT